VRNATPRLWVRGDRRRHRQPSASKATAACIAGEKIRHQVTPVLHRGQLPPPADRAVLRRWRAAPSPCRQRHDIKAATSSTQPQHPEMPPGTSIRSILGECTLYLSSERKSRVQTLCPWKIWPPLLNNPSYRESERDQAVQAGSQWTDIYTLLHILSMMAYLQWTSHLSYQRRCIEKPSEWWHHCCMVRCVRC
jgi:hypothetical protein